ncbi:hypothetical protein [Aquimarina longa]|uniref:hypothetical protein n=1 Tax=Aquimarina longa TaxID=1080221 RepID=UPI000785D4EF|nr:hypothetical protein [Aquimarina longa]
MEFTKIDEFNESLSHLGFWERFIYKFDSNACNSTTEIIDLIFKSDILFKTEECINYEGLTPKKHEIRTNHCFTDKIRFKDLEKLNFKEYVLRIDEIKKEEDWGVDLPIFIKLIDKSIIWIKENNYQNEQIFFIDSEKISKEKLIDFNYYSYLITTIIISQTDSKIIIINHGGD